MVAPTKRCTFDGVAEGASVTAASTASGSGNPLDNASGSGTGVAKAAAAIYGTKGVEISGAGVGRFLQWQPALVDALGAQLAFTVPPAAISATMALVRVQNSGGTIGGDLQLTTAGLLRVTDNSGAVVHTFNGGVALPAGDYVAQITVVKGTTSSNGRILAWCRKVADDTLVSAAYDSGTTLNTGTVQFNRINAGKVATSGTLTIDVDAFAYLSGSTAEIDRVAAPNLPPEADADPDKTVNEGASVTLTGVGSSDPDGTIASYAWAQLSGPAVVLSNPNVMSPTFTAPSGPATLVFQLTVTDDDGATDTDTITVNVLDVPPPNVAPTAAAGPDQTVASGAAVVTLTGAGSSDPDGTIASYAWAQLSGPAVVLAGSGAGRTFTAPLGPASLSFRLTVTDDDGATDTDDVTITVNAPPAPVDDASVELRLGAWTESLTIGDPADPSADVYVLDGLTLGWRQASEEVQAPLEPMTATVTIAVRDVADLPDVEQHDLASVRVLDEDAAVVASLYGRIQEVTATQVQRLTAVGVLEVWTQVTYLVVGHDALVDVPFDLTAVVSSWNNRIQAIEAAIPGAPPIRLVPFTGDTRWVSGRARGLTYSGAGLVATLRAMVAEMALAVIKAGATTETLSGRLMLAPISDPITGALELLSFHVIPLDEPTVLPAVGTPHRVDGARVHLSGTYRKSAAAAVNHVTLKTRNNDDTANVKYVSYSPKFAVLGPVVRRVVDSQVATAPDAAVIPVGSEGPPLAKLYRQAPPADGWDRDGFTYEPATFSDLTGGWFPDWSSTVWRTTTARAPHEEAAACFVDLVAIHGLPDASNLSGEPGLYVGRLTFAELTIRGGRPVVTFGLRREAVT